MKKFLNIPERTAKPRETGVTMVMDKGLSVAGAQGVLENGADYIDFVKLGWGTSYVCTNVEEKIRLYGQAGIKVYLGGTFFEICHAQKKLTDYRDLLKDLGISWLEISNGATEISMKEKSKWIEFFANDFQVLTEVGSKDADLVKSTGDWIAEIESDLAAGAWKVITEARESGNVGIYFSNEGVRLNLLEEICRKIDKDRLIFEAPKKSQQAYLVNHFGSEVNLGNVAPDEIVGLETLRLGLRADTIHLLTGGI